MWRVPSVFFLCTFDVTMLICFFSSDWWPYRLSCTPEYTHRNSLKDNILHALPPQQICVPQWAQSCHQDRSFIKYQLRGLLSGITRILQKQSVCWRLCLSCYKSGTKSEMNNFRPLSLLNIIHKVLGKCVKIQLDHTQNIFLERVPLGMVGLSNALSNAWDNFNRISVRFYSI